MHNRPKVVKLIIIVLYSLCVCVCEGEKEREKERERERERERKLTVLPTAVSTPATNTTKASRRVKARFR